MFNKRTLFIRFIGNKKANYLIFTSNKPFTLGFVDDFVIDGELQYSTDTENWNTWNGETLNSNNINEIYLRGIGVTLINPTNSGGFILTPSSDNKISCIGNIENLLDYQTVMHNGHPIMSDYCFAALFKNCTSLVQANVIY